MAGLVLKSAQKVAGSTVTYGTVHQVSLTEFFYPMIKCGRCFEIRLYNIPFVCGSNELRLAKYINAKPVNI